ncbi:MAG: glycosyltransferase [Symploca sp. SIO2D2]|nr:glycosyltransferase [Symploca sp. SIO2D2]
MKASILINNYNNELYLEQCIESAVKQSCPAHEVIIYDDGSTDGSRDIIDGFAKDHPKIKTIYRSNYGKAHNINQANGVYQAFKSSSGDQIFLLDGDDAYEPNHLESYQNAFKQQEQCVVQSPLICIDRSGTRTHTKEREQEAIKDPFKFVSANANFSFYYTTSAVAITRDLLEKALPHDFAKFPLFAIDAILCLYGAASGNLQTVEEPSTLYRIHGENRSSRFHSKRFRLKFDYQSLQYYNLVAANWNKPRLSRGKFLFQRGMQALRKALS